MISKCLVCKNDFLNYPSWGRKYCSQECSAKSQISHVERKCLVCGKEYFIFKGQANRGIRRYCSLKCYYPTIAGKTKKCPVCNKEFKVFRSQADNRKYCSWKCRIQKMNGENHWNWQGGLSLEPYTVDWTETLKKGIRERDNYTCGVCENKQIEMDVHHIDYNKKNCNPTNLVTLCHGCHTKTGRNRDYWIKYFDA